MKTAVILVAGGNGTRMGGETPKQFLLLGGMPLLMHTVRCFSEALPQVKMIVVLPEGQTTHWASLCEEYAFTIEHTVVSGGKTRFHSVKNGLEETADCDYIGVHDGVRPLAAQGLIVRVWEAAQNFGAAIPVIPLTDSIREVVYCDSCQDKSEIIDSKPADRNRFAAVQTPQFFRQSILVKAYEQDYSAHFTDDASVVEAAGYEVSLVPGDPANLKVTTPVDLALAEVLIKR